MRVAQSWVTEILQRANPGWQIGRQELDDAFTKVGLEVEEVDPLPPITGPLVVGRVLSFENLEGFKKPIRFVQVDVGNADPQEIVCGASNFRDGDLVVVALPGVVLPGDFAIAARKTYGKVSDGMICSVSELGIGADHSGILVLAPGTAAPGEDATVVLGTDDVVFDVNITPDRGYWYSLRGVTRELANGLDLEFLDPAAVPALPVAGEGYPVRLDAAAGAKRFVVRKVSGIDPQAVSPWWLQRRLLLSGIRPISPAVDVTNYVMTELGQPLHAFDAAKLQGPLVVRLAALGEHLTTLDDVDRTLDPSDVVIADDSGVLSLAGVMGGATTEVSASTTDVLLEAATWDSIAIFKTGRRHKLSSEAAKRFERQTDPALPNAALDRAAALLVEIAGGSVDEALTDLGEVPVRDAIHMPLDLPDRIAGVAYPNGTAARRLTQLGAHVEVGTTEAGTGELIVTPPSWRPDLQMPADLVEEVLRLEGLERIPSVLPSAPAGRGYTREQRRRRVIGRALAYDGFVEVPSPVFLPAGVFDQWGLAEDDPRRRTVTVLNPLEADRPEISSTLLAGLLEVTARNIARGARDLAVFALAQVAIAKPGAPQRIEPLPPDRRPTDQQIQHLLDALPDQPSHVAGVLTGLREPAGPWGPGRAATAADAFEATDAVADAAGVRFRRRATDLAPLHPGRGAELVLETEDGEVVVGYAGELHPAVLERMGLPPRTCGFEIDLDAVPIRENLPAPRISAFPAVLQDVALVVDEDVPAESVRAALVSGAGPLLEDAALFDVYRSEAVGARKKSLAFALRFRADDRTLTEDEASASRDAAVAAAASATGAVLRA